VHGLKGGRGRGDGKDHALPGTGSQRRQRGGDVGRPVVDQAVHGGDPVEGTVGRVEHVAGDEADAGREFARKAVARHVEQVAGDVDGGDGGAAAGRLDGEGARPAARVEQRLAGHVGG
jgi:hypothetical protein